MYLGNASSYNEHFIIGERFPFDDIAKRATYNTIIFGVSKIVICTVKIISATAKVSGFIELMQVPYNVPSTVMTFISFGESLEFFK